MYCKNCGKEINDNAVVCPYCGVATDKLDKAAVGGKKINGFGIAGFVVSLASLLWLGIYFCIAGIIGLVLSIVGIKNRKNSDSCNGLAIAGLVIGIISLVVWGLLWIIVGAAILSV